MEVRLEIPDHVRGGDSPAISGALGDDLLARRVGRGSERAFAMLYARYHQPLYRYCRSLVRHDSDAEDALQSTFTAAFSALRRGQRDAPLRPWLFRIAHNESMSLLRRRRTSGALIEAPEQPVPSVERTVADRARLALLVADLQALPERQRGALLMREMSGLSHEEVAVALGVSLGVAKQTVFEARRSLMEFEEGRAMPCEEIQRVISDGDRRALRGRRVRAHLRDCSGCAAFATAIPARRSDLLALSPALPAAAASSLLGRVIAGGSGHGGGAGGAVATAAGKGVAAVLPLKALAAGVVVVATAAAGAGVLTHLGRTPRPARAPVTQRSARGAAVSSPAAVPTTRRSVPRASKSMRRTHKRAAVAGRLHRPVHHAAHGGGAGRARGSAPVTAAGSPPNPSRSAAAGVPAASSGGLGSAPQRHGTTGAGGRGAGRRAAQGGRPGSVGAHAPAPRGGAPAGRRGAVPPAAGARPALPALPAGKPTGPAKPATPSGPVSPPAVPGTAGIQSGGGGGSVSGRSAAGQGRSTIP